MLIPYHSSWEILDASKLEEFDSCPRSFFYKYILGWRPDIPAHDLHFGTSWHDAREYQLIHGYDKIDEAFEAFLTTYREVFDESTDDYYRPKCPEGVKHALANFALTYHDDLELNELLRNPDTNEPFTEISGTVPISDNRVLHFRMDSLLRNKKTGKIFSWDHKSSSTYIKYNAWDNQFQLKLQNGTYTHCMYCIFPVDDVLGVEFDGCGFEYLSRGSRARPAGCYSILKRVPAFKSKQEMNVWLWLVNELYDRIEIEMDKLSRCKEGDNIMQAFPLSPNSCSKYRGCPFFDLCINWPNPLRRCQEPAMGFKQEFWDPTTIKSRNKLNLEWS